MRRACSVIAALAAVLAACASTRTEPAASSAPLADHHLHAFGPASVARGREPLPEPVAVPAEIAQLLEQRARHWDDAQALSALYAQDAQLLAGEGRTWVRGRADVAEQIAGRFSRAYRITPIAFHADGGAAHVAGFLTRGEGDAVKHFGHVLLALGLRDGAWRIEAETLAFPGPFVLETLGAEALIAQLDAAGIRRGAVLSVAYWFGSGAVEAADELAHVRAENDWVAAECARFPDRLVGLCSFNPLRDYAQGELRRCATSTSLAGLKLHFGNSRVDVHDATHVAKVRAVFEAANALHYPIVVHLWTDPAYGAEEARIFLERILPGAPDVPVQIAHMAGGGPGYTDAALGVFAESIARHDARTQNLYFDVATVVDPRIPAETLAATAARIRAIGPGRFVWGTDASPPNPPSREAWAIFRAYLPLSDDEVRVIRENVLPWLR